MLKENFRLAASLVSGSLRFHLLSFLWVILCAAPISATPVPPQSEPPPPPQTRSSSDRSSSSTTQQPTTDRTARPEVRPGGTANPTGSTASQSTSSRRETQQRPSQPSTSPFGTSTNRGTTSDRGTPRQTYRDEAEGLITRGQQFEQRGEINKAESLYQEALVKREQQYGREHLAVAAAADNLGEINLQKGDFATAGSYYQRSLTIREKSLKPNHPQIAESLNGLAVTYVRAGELTKAEPLYKRALEIQEQAFGAKHPSVATILNNYGVLYEYQKDYGNAISYYNRALLIREKSLGKNHPDVALSLSNLGLVYKNIGQLESAETHFQRVLTILEKNSKENSRPLIQTLNHLADVQSARGNFKLAEGYLERVVAVRDKMTVKSDMEMIQSLYRLGNAYTENKKYPEAIQVNQRALSLAEQKFGSDDMSVASILNNEGKVYTLQKAYAEAAQRFERALSISEKTPGAEGYSRVILHNLAVTYQNLGQKEKALSFEQRGNALEAQLAKANQQNTSPPATAVQRFPTIESPDQVNVEQEFAVQVSLTEDMTTPEAKVREGKTTAEGKLALNLPEKANQEPWKIDVVIVAPGFTITSSNLTSITLPRQGDSTVALFRLRAKPIANAQQASSLIATLWHNGTYLAKIARPITIVGTSTETAAPQGASSFAAAAPKIEMRPQKTSAPGIMISPQQQTADLTIFLLEEQRPNQPAEITMILDSPYLQVTKTTFKVPDGLADLLEANYQRFAHRGATTVPIATGQATAQREIVHEIQGQSPVAQEQTAALMRGFGRELYQKFAPPEFKEAFWKLSDKLGKRFTSIQIYSDNPALPWELMRPTRPDGSGERDFLGAEFMLGRWHVNQGTSQLTERPPQSLVMEKLIAVAPQYTGRNALASQQIELQAMSKIRGYSSLRGDLGSMKKLLEDLPQGIVHFAGHGGIKTTGHKLEEFVIRLEDADLDLLMWRGLMSRPNQKHPFFFFNACEVGQTQRVANFVNGWAPAVLEKGASGYIGALWPIGDKGAAEFSKRFYETLEQELQQGPTTIGEVLRKTRHLFVEKADPTYLAYVYYGDPNLRFVGLSPK